MSDTEDSDTSSTDDILDVPLFSPPLIKEPVSQSPEIGPSVSLQERLQSLQRNEAILQSFATVQNPMSQPQSQEIYDIPPLKGQFVFTQFHFSPCSIAVPLITPEDISENSLLEDLKQYLEAAYSESKDSFYHTLLLTNLLKDIDSIHVLPSSVYSMLFLIAVLSKDEIACIQAESLLLELIQRHSGFKLDLVRCVPSQEVLLSIWDLFGYSETTMNLRDLLDSHMELREEIVWDGSVRSSLVESFPLLQFRHYLQLLLFLLSVLGEDRDQFSDETLITLLERLIRCLLEPRTVLLQKVMSECIASIVSILQKRGVSMKRTIQQIVSKESVEEVRVLRELIVRMPVMNPVLEVFRCVLAFQVLLRSQSPSLVCNKHSLDHK